MNTYHVTYFYLASGMEGQADVRDHGFVYADSPDEAKRSVVISCYPRMSGEDLQFLMGCLSAKDIRGDSRNDWAGSFTERHREAIRERQNKRRSN